MASIALAAATWLVVRGMQQTELPFVTVPVERATAPVRADQVMEGETMREAMSELEAIKLRTAQARPSAASGDADTRRTAFEERFARTGRATLLSFVHAPSLLEPDDLVRDPTLNPRDMTVDEQMITALREIVEGHLDVIAVITDASNREAHRLAMQLAQQGGVHDARDVVMRFPQETLDLIDIRSKELSAKRSIPVEAARRSVQGQFASAHLDADATIMLGGQVYLAPNGSIDPQLSDYTSLQRHLSSEMLVDVAGVFANAGCLSPQEVMVLVEQFYAAAAATPN